MGKLNFGRTGRARVALIAFLGTLGCTIVALLTVSYTTQFMPPGLPRTLSFAAAYVVPLLMSAPIFYVFADKLRQLAVAHEELAVIASSDSLTSCLNRGAFVTLVDAYLTQVNSPHDIRGSLLVIDADRFKVINDRFGHSAGDTALRLISSAIKSVIRSVDLVGRVGGEEFAVFLPQADRDVAARVAERIRLAVASTTFQSRDEDYQLSVSIGGVSFQRRANFDEIFNAADARMYEAKRSGRNRVVFGGELGSLAATG